MKILNLKNKNGITLIALVITIIVLLILAAISITMLTGDNSILKRAVDAKERTGIAEIEEQKRLTMLEAASNVNGENYNGVKIPAGYAATKKEGESTADEGLVITDSEGNEYVWIEVPTTAVDNSVTGGPDYTAVKNEEENSDKYYEEIAKALRAYCTKDAKGEDLIKDGTKSDGDAGKFSTYGYIDVWYDGAGKLENDSASNKDDKTGCGLTCNEYKELYKKMLKSVYTNGGFWIGRYEAGITFPRGDKNDPIEGLKAESKQDLYPINYVKCSQAQTLASKASSNGKVSSSLMFGIQWDLVLKFLSNKGVETKFLINNSENWGNYKLEYPLNQSTAHGYKGIDASYKLAWSGIENGYTHNGTEYIALSTGATERNKKKNIYDLAGNMYEFTLEYTNIAWAMIPCTYRGGNFYNGGGNAVSFRGYYTTSGSSCDIGFRISLY